MGDGFGGLRTVIRALLSKVEVCVWEMSLESSITVILEEIPWSKVSRTETFILKTVVCVVHRRRRSYTPSRDHGSSTGCHERS